MLVAAAPIRPLAWELPYAAPAGNKQTNKQTNKKQHPTSTAAARVAVDVWVQFLARHSGLKDPALPQLQLGFNPWPQEPYAPGEPEINK